MIVRGLLLAAILCSGAASTGFAQHKDPLPRVVADVRGASAGLPTGLGWTPAVPQGTLIPGRGLGVEIGGHIYVARFKLGGIGIGSTLLLARGEASPPEPSSPPPPTFRPLPAVATRLTSLIPQVSFNFGHRLGFSYLSGGVGRTRAHSEVAEPVAGTQIAPAESPWVRTINYGGGARWFINDHIGVSVDLRWFKVAAVAQSATQTALPKQSLLTASAGITLK
jgi:hypothetical protein